MPSIVTSIIGGIQGASASHNAANALSGGYNAAGQTVTNAAAAVNPTLTTAAATGASEVTNAGGAVTTAANTAANNATTAAKARLTRAKTRIGLTGPTAPRIERPGMGRPMLQRSWFS